MMNDPRIGRRPRNAPTTRDAFIDLGEADGKSIPTGFSPEPTDEETPRERDYRGAPSALPRDVEALPAKNLRDR